MTHVMISWSEELDVNPQAVELVNEGLDWACHVEHKVVGIGDEEPVVEREPPLGLHDAEPQAREDVWVGQIGEEEIVVIVILGVALSVGVREPTGEHRMNPPRDTPFVDIMYLYIVHNVETVMHYDPVREKLGNL